MLNLNLKNKVNFFFHFEGKNYKKTDGVALRSLLEPTLSNTFLMCP